MAISSGASPRYDALAWRLRLDVSFRFSTRAAGGFAALSI